MPEHGGSLSGPLNSGLRSGQRVAEYVLVERIIFDHLLPICAIRFRFVGFPMSGISIAIT